MKKVLGIHSIKLDVNALTTELTLPEFYCYMHYTENDTIKHFQYTGLQGGYEMVEMFALNVQISIISEVELSRV